MSLLPTPTVFWVGADANASPGLYVSPTSIHFPETMRSQQPGPWKYYYPRVMNEETLPFCWTAILPRRLVFDGFLTPLNNIELEEIVINKKSTWRLNKSLFAEWDKIEATLIRASHVLDSMVLPHLNMDVTSKSIPWPSVYEYHRDFPNRKTAMSAIRSVRAVFMLKIAKLSYLDFVNSKSSPTWLDVAEDQRLLPLSDINSIRLSSICTRMIVTPNTERVGMIIDVRSPMDPGWQAELEKLISAFDLPFWIYFGMQPSSDHRLCHRWYLEYMPSAGNIKYTQENMPAVQGIRTYVPNTTLQTTSHGEAISVTQTGNIATRNVSALPSQNMSGPRPDPSTGQIPGETHKEFFNRQHAAIQAAYNTGTPMQLALWNARREKYKDLECPDNTYRPTVFQWEEDKDQREVRVLVGRKHWQAAFQSSARTQRKYSEVLNEFDICIFLDPQAIVDEEEEYIYVSPYNREHALCPNIARRSSTEQSSADTPENQQARGRQTRFGHQVPDHLRELERREQDSRPTVEQPQVLAGNQSSLTRVLSLSPLRSRFFIHPLVSHTAPIQNCPAYPRHGPSSGRSRDRSRDRSSSSCSCSRSPSSRSRCRSRCQSPHHSHYHSSSSRSCSRLMSSGSRHSSMSGHSFSRQYYRTPRSDLRRVTSSRSRSPIPRRHLFSSQRRSHTPDGPHGRLPLHRRMQSLSRGRLQTPCQDTCSATTLDADSPPVTVEPMKLETAMWIRYGIFTSSINHINHEIPAELKKRYEWLCKPGKVQMVLGHHAENMPQKKLEAIRVYLGYIGFEHENSPRLSVPIPMADTINPSHSRTPYNLKRHIMITPSNVEGETWYQLIPWRSPLRDVEYTIIVKDPLAVNQVLREGTARSTYDLAAYFVSRGIAFKTAQYYGGTRHMMWPSPPMPMLTAQIALGLGTRESCQGKLTLDDYREYEASRDAVIRGYDGRAALLAGGIVWRIAFDSVGDPEKAINGPGELPTRKNYFLMEDEGYIDDVLNDHQEAVICGVYCILPSEYQIEFMRTVTTVNKQNIGGITNATSQPVFISWWPSATTWKESGMDVGYWTESNEKWFSDRLAKILTGQEHPKTASEWKSVLQHSKTDTKRILSTTRALAAASLSQ
jgi:hypothetical protein